MPRETKLYDLLDIQPSSSSEEIKKAFRKKSLTHHPDKGGDAEIYKKINGAYEILSDPEKRKLYDEGGEDGLRNSGQMSEDVLSKMFGNMFGGGGGFPFGGGSPFGQSPFGGSSPFQRFNTSFFQNLNTKLEPSFLNYKVTLEDLAKRKVVKLKITRDRVCPNINESELSPCFTCNGKGVKVKMNQLAPGMFQQIQSPCDTCRSKGKIYPTCDNCKEGRVQDIKIIELHLNPELENGYKYVFQNEGNNDFGKQPGDFVVVIQYEEHSIFQVQGMNLLYTHTLTLKEALCGYKLELKHPSGEIISISTSGVTNPETVETIPHKGLSYQSDMIVKYRIVFPTTLTQDQTEILKNVL
jgi:DnaJ-class molecular chaperone